MMNKIDAKQTNKGKPVDESKKISYSWLFQTDRIAVLWDHENTHNFFTYSCPYDWFHKDQVNEYDEEENNTDGIGNDPKVIHWSHKPSSWVKKSNRNEE